MIKNNFSSNNSNVLKHNNIVIGICFWRCKLPLKCKQLGKPGSCVVCQTFIQNAFCHSKSRLECKCLYLKCHLLTPLPVQNLSSCLLKCIISLLLISLLQSHTSSSSEDRTTDPFQRFRIWPNDEQDSQVSPPSNWLCLQSVMP